MFFFLVSLYHTIDTAAEDNEVRQRERVDMEKEDEEVERCRKKSPGDNGNINGKRKGSRLGDNAGRSRISPNTICPCDLERFRGYLYDCVEEEKRVWPSVPP